MEKIKDILKDKFKTDDFIQENKNLVYKVIRKTFPSVLDTYEAEDYVQEGLASLYKAMVDYDESKEIKFCTFAYIVIQRELLKRVKHEKNKLNQCKNHVYSLNVAAYDNDECEDDYLDILPGNLNTEDEVIRKEYNNYLSEHIDILNKKLKPYHKQVLRYLMEGKNQAEIARLMDCSRENIRQKVNTIKRIAGNMKIA